MTFGHGYPPSQSLVRLSFFGADADTNPEPTPSPVEPAKPAPAPPRDFRPLTVPAPVLAAFNAVCTQRGEEPTNVLVALLRQEITRIGSAVLLPPHVYKEALGHVDGFNEHQPACKTDDG